MGLVESHDPNGRVAPTSHFFYLLATKGCRETVDGMVEKGAKDGEKRCGRNNFFDFMLVMLVAFIIVV